MEGSIPGNGIQIKSAKTGQADFAPVSVGSQASASERVEQLDPVERIRPAREQQGSLQQRMEELARRLQDFVRENSRELEFRVGEQQGEVVILVREADSGKVLRTIPPEEAQGLAESLAEGAAALVDRLA